MKRAHIIVSILLAGLGACAPATASGPAPAPCGPGMKPMVRDVLYFGRSIPGGGTVNDSAWTKFVAEVITPAFPDGFTVTSGMGQWRDAGGNIVSESSMIVTITRPDTGDNEAAVLGLGERYRVIFHQEAVMHEHANVCVSFVGGA